MRIKKILSQNRRDFRAIFECEHCEKTIERNGYDDHHFHNNVVPTMPCEFCGEISPPEYRPQKTRYPKYVQV